MTSVFITFVWRKFTVMWRAHTCSQAVPRISVCWSLSLLWKYLNEPICIHLRKWSHDYANEDHHEQSHVVTEIFFSKVSSDLFKTINFLKIKSKIRLWWPKLNPCTYTHFEDTWKPSGVLYREISVFISDAHQRAEMVTAGLHNLSLNKSKLHWDAGLPIGELVLDQF